MMTVMNERLKQLMEEAGYAAPELAGRARELVKLIVEETLNEVDERVYGRSENQWYYENDKEWIRLHFGYGKLAKKCKT